VAPLDEDDLYTSRETCTHFKQEKAPFELELAVTAAQPVHRKIPDPYALVLEDDAYPNAHYLQTEQST
jgi:hypothetical protein